MRHILSAKPAARKIDRASGRRLIQSSKITSHQTVRQVNLLLSTAAVKIWNLMRRMTRGAWRAGVLRRGRMSERADPAQLPIIVRHDQQVTVHPTTQLAYTRQAHHSLLLGLDCKAVFLLRVYCDNPYRTVFSHIRRMPYRSHMLKHGSYITTRKLSSGQTRNGSRAPV